MKGYVAALLLLLSFGGLSAVKAGPTECTVSATLNGKPLPNITFALTQGKERFDNIPRSTRTTRADGKRKFSRLNPKLTYSISVEDAPSGLSYLHVAQPVTSKTMHFRFRDLDDLVTYAVNRAVGRLKLPNGTSKTVTVTVPEKKLEAAADKAITANGLLLAVAAIACMCLFMILMLYWRSATSWNTLMTHIGQTPSSRLSSPSLGQRTVNWFKEPPKPTAEPSQPTPDDSTKPDEQNGIHLDAGPDHPPLFGPIVSRDPNFPPDTEP